MGVTANYSVAARLQTMKVVMQVGNVPLGIQVWNVTSRGDVDSGQDAQVEIDALVENVARPAFGFAAFGIAQVCGSVSMGGGATTDSFDSEIGTYEETKTDSGGNIGSNGNIYLNGPATEVNGSASSPRGGSGDCTAVTIPGLEIENGATLTEGQQLLAGPLIFPPPPPADPMTPTNNQSVTGNNNLCSAFTVGCTEPSSKNITLTPGSYGNVSVSSGNILHLTAGTYSFNSLILTGAAQIVIDSGPVILNLAGQGLSGSSPVIDVSGGSEIVNAGGVAKDLQILYAGGQPVNLSGGASSYGVVYTPSANVTINGNNDWYGSFVGRTVNGGGGMQLHYDRSLGDDFYIRGEYRPISFNWKKY
jgi:hypothetical protein